MNLHPVHPTPSSLDFHHAGSIPSELYSNSILPGQQGLSSPTPLTHFSGIRDANFPPSSRPTLSSPMQSYAHIPDPPSSPLHPHQPPSHLSPSYQQTPHSALPLHSPHPSQARSPPHAGAPSPPAPTEYSGAGSTPYNYSHSAGPKQNPSHTFTPSHPTHLNTIYGNRNLSSSHDINPLPSNSSVPMLMLMDNAQNSLIETLQRQLAEERERGAHRLQTETLMHQLISERNENESRVKEEHDRYELDRYSLETSLSKKLNESRDTIMHSQRQLTSQKRFASEVTAENEKLKKEVARLSAGLTAKDSAQKIQLEKNLALFEEEKARYHTELSHRQRTYDEQQATMNRQHSTLLDHMKTKFAAEERATEKTFENLKLEYHTKALMFEKEAEKIKDLAQAAKVKGENAIVHLKRDHADSSKVAALAHKKLQEKLIQLKWINVMKTNAWKAKYVAQQQEFEGTFTRERTQSDLDMRKVANDHSQKVEMEQNKLHAVRENHTNQIHELHNLLKQKQEEYHNVIAAVKDEHKAQLSSEVARLGEQQELRLASAINDLNEKKQEEFLAAKEQLSILHLSELDSRDVANKKDLDFFEAKIKELESNLQASAAATLSLSTGHKESMDDANVSLASTLSTLSDTKTALDKVNAQLASSQTKFVASKALFDEAEVKIAALTSVSAARDTAESALASASSRVDTLEPQNALLESELNDIKAKFDHAQIESASKIETLTDKLRELTKTASTLQSQLANEKAGAKAHSGKESEALKDIKKNHNKMVAEKDAALSHNTDEIAKLKEQVAHMKTDAVAKKLHDATATAKIKRNLENKVVKLEEEAKQKDLQVSRIPEFEEAIVNQTAQLKQFQTDLNASRERVEQMEEENEDLKVRVAAVPALEMKVATLSTTVAKQEEALSKLEEERAKLEEENKELAHETEVAEERVRDLGAKLVATTDDFTSSARIFEKDEEKLAHVMRELDVATQRIRELEDENSHLRAQLEKKEGGRPSVAVDLQLMTKNDLKLVVSHIEHVLGNDEDEISLKMFEQAIRSCRRAKSCAQEHVKGRLLVFKLEQLIDAQGITPMQWYKQVVEQHGLAKNEHGETGLSSNDVRKNLRALHKRMPKLEELKEEEIQALVHYMDPNLDGHITKSEMKDAFRRASMPPNGLYAEYQCGIAMAKLEKYMHDKRERIADLFKEFDVDESGYVSTKEFCVGIEKFVGLKKSRRLGGGGAADDEQERTAREDGGDGGGDVGRGGEDGGTGEAQGHPQVLELTYVMQK